MDIPNSILDITGNQTPGYHPLTNYGGWRVAVFNEDPAGTLDTMAYLEYHALTDEVFILLKGKCTLFVSGGSDRPENIFAAVMEPLKCYNVKKGVWHNLLLSEGGAVVIVENHNTRKENSVYHYLSEEDRRMLRMVV